MRQHHESDTIIDMFRKKLVLQYESAVEVYPNIITPAKNHVPEWYKKIPKFKDNTIFEIDRGFAPTIKLCAPFLDSLTSGYVISLPYDLYVKNNNGAPYLTWPEAVTDKIAPKWRKQTSHEKIVPSGCYSFEYTWNPCVAFVFPKGYSFLITHPLNRHDLPFITLSGIIDGGFAVNAHGNFPFYIKENFEGIINKGTPIMQIIPFRQEKWKSKKIKGLVELSILNQKKSTSVIYGWYKKMFWIKKEYD